MCAHTLHRSRSNLFKTCHCTKTIDHTTVFVYIEHVYSSGQQTSERTEHIQSKYPVTDAVLAGSGPGTGFENKARYPANRIRICGTSLIETAGCLSVWVDNCFCGQFDARFHGDAVTARLISVCVVVSSCCSSSALCRVFVIAVFLSVNYLLLVNIAAPLHEPLL